MPSQSVAAVEPLIDPPTEIHRLDHRTDPTHDILRKDYQPLTPFFSPKAIAVIGATEKPGSVGRTLMWNLMSSSFGGTVFPVNPKRSSVLGIKAYPDLRAVPEVVDLAVIAIPAARVPEVIQDCVASGVKAAIVLSAGFKEIGPEGIQLEQDILRIARQGNLRIIGPNCLGVMCPTTGLNATFAGAIARPGNVGFISQSGALCTSILDWSFRENVGFSAFISIGSMLDVGWGGLIDYLGDDPHTHSIVIYMESIGNARAFLSAAREVALSKPIIVIKSGRTQAAAQAAASHTGALSSSDDVLDAAFRRCGVLRVNTIDELFNMAEILGKQPRPKGKRLTIVTNAGGPGVLATDALIQGRGSLASLSGETIMALNQVLPPHWSCGNPIDILGDATPDRYAQTLEIVAKDPNSDGLLVILTPQAMTDPIATAEKLAAMAPRLRGKPLLASWMGGDTVAAGEKILNQANIFTFPYPDTAAQTFNLMAQYSDNLRALYETPRTAISHASTASLTTFAPPTSPTAILQNAQKSHRTLLSEWESKQLLKSYGIPTVETRVAKTVDEAEAIASDIGYPVVLKLHSHTITHKTDVGGVQLSLRDAAAVRAAFTTIQTNVLQHPQSAASPVSSPTHAPSLAEGASPFLGVTVQPMVSQNKKDGSGYELILGSSLDPQFGPVLLFGSGGQLVEVFRDRALGLPPLTTTLARRMMERTHIYHALKGVRGRQPIDMEALEQLLVRFSQLVIDHPAIQDIEINPLLVSSDRILALDARVVLADPTTDPAALPTAAIRPYPSQYVYPWILKNNLPVTIRPLCPEDEPLVVNLHKTLSEESVYCRYFHLISLHARISHERLTRICFLDYDREIAIVADYNNPDTGDHEILGVARLSKLHGRNEAEFGLLVSDRYHGQGLGTQLLRSLLDIGRAEGLDCISATILRHNTTMIHLCEQLGFESKRCPDGIAVRYSIGEMP
ncbi:MAG: bifunctional acetate--CoA ligase family protein/GNAT family N-acetyltransferase [Merismopedia sp. SIO2A8]|nr:bifunctional acetate--CoA ligase family protein/GNAT family N-acetyltransferase [Merismopedia sp. SIO2A8]